MCGRRADLTTRRHSADPGDSCRQILRGAARLRDGDGLPRFVERAFREFLRCGFLAGGFARFHCCGCGLDRLVPFSCKGRALCPSCGGGRLAELRAVAPDSLHNLLRDLFEAITLWDVRADGARVQPSGGGSYRVTLEKLTGRDLSITVSDTTGEMLVVNARTAPDFPIAWGVRASMSMPLLPGSLLHVRQLREDRVDGRPRAREHRRVPLRIEARLRITQPPHQTGGSSTVSIES